MREIITPMTLSPEKKRREKKNENIKNKTKPKEKLETH